MQWQQHITALQGWGWVVGPHLLLPWALGSAGMGHWSGAHGSLWHLSREVESGWRMLFSSQSGGKFLLSQHTQSLPCHAQAPGKDQGMEERLLIALPLLFYPKSHTQRTAHEAQAGRKASGAGGSARNIPPSQGLHFQLNSCKSHTNLCH